MWNDPIVEATRKLRDAYASQFNYDIQAIVDDLKQWELAEKNNLHEVVKPAGRQERSRGWPAG